MLLRLSQSTERIAPQTTQTPLDRRVINEVGNMEGPGPFEFIVKAATVEAALEQDPAWPPEELADAIQMYQDYQERYVRGELDCIVNGLDLNSVVANAAYFSQMSPKGIFPPRRNWDMLPR